jgi:hypothetical protein
MREFARPEHEIISGMIGMGKSYLVLWKIVQSFAANRPCCYIDPKGDTYRALLAFFSGTRQGRELWQRYRHRILLLNPVSASDYLLAFNALEPMGAFYFARPDRVALLADNLTSHIRRQSGFEVNEAMRMQNILSAAIGILVQGGAGKLTLAELPYLFLPAARQRLGGKEFTPTYNAFVAALLPAVSHFGTASFWQLQWRTMLPNDRRSWVQSSEGRIYPYLFDSRCLMSTCAVDNARLDFNGVVQEGQWLFVNLPYSLLSEQISTLLGNLLVTKLFYACMQRRDTTLPYRIILDEARFFNTGPLDRLLETSRAYNLWLTLVVQSLSQLCRSREGRQDYTLRDTALNNVRYWSTFNLSQPEDARTLAGMMYPLTGTLVRGIRSNGDWDYQAPQVEEDAHARRLMGLSKRELIVYDKLGRGGPQGCRTPEVIMDPADERQVELFEAQHLQLLGRPAEAIMGEILARREQVEKLLAEGTGEGASPRKLGVPNVGGLP